MKSLPVPFPAALAVATLAAVAAGQCALDVLPGGAFPGIRGPIDVIRRWDPDGPGPAGTLIVAGGEFTLVGGVISPNVAAFDPQTSTWRAIGSGVNGRVRAVLPMPNGDLIVAGDITSASGTPASRIARWNGTAWSPLGPGFNPTVYALARTPDDRVVAAGSFRSLGNGAPMLSIAAWDGLTWSPLGTGLSSGAYSVTVAPNGDVIAGGVFFQAGGNAASRVARWNGTSWSAIGGGLSQNAFCVLAPSSGDIFVGLEGPPYFQRWDGATWSDMGLAPNLAVASLELAANGDLIVGGDFTSIAAGAADHVARWNGTSWSPLAGNRNGRVRGLCEMPGGDLAVGCLENATGPTGRFDPTIRRWNGSEWSTLGVGTDQNIFAVARLQTGDLVVGGLFTSIDGFPLNHIARWDGTSWHPLGSGIDGVVYSLDVLPNGDLLVGGLFEVAGGVAARNIARWNGTTWSRLGGGLGRSSNTGAVIALVHMPNGDIVATGLFSSATNSDGTVVNAGQIARWDGVRWHAMGSVVYQLWAPAFVALVALPNGELLLGGDLYAVGTAAAPGTRIWDGSTWRNGPIVEVTTALHLLEDGDLVAATLGGSILRLHGAVATSLGQSNGIVTKFGRAPNGDLVAAGGFTSISGTPAAGLARWNGTAWLPFSSGLGSGIGGGRVNDFCTTPAGEIALGGSFSEVLGEASVFFARIRSTCPASAPSKGAGCSGSYGPVTLTADTTPWIGGPYHLTATGFGPNSLAVWYAGTTQPAVPVSSLLAQGLPGCMLWSSFEVEFGFSFPVAGIATQTVFVPNLPALVGLTFQKQVADVEVDPSLAIHAIATSNGIALTVGVF